VGRGRAAGLPNARRHNSDSKMFNSFSNLMLIFIKCAGLKQLYSIGMKMAFWKPSDSQVIDL
jgi:hypothetical protein